MGQFPVQHGPQAVRANHEIAEPEVSVHDGPASGRWAIGLQPTEHELEGGMRLTEAVERGAVLLDLVDRRQRRHGEGVDRMEPSQRPRAVDGQTCAGWRELLVPQDLARDRLAIDVTEHHVRGTQLAGVRRGCDDLRHRHTAGTCGAENGHLHTHVAYVAGTLALQDQRASAERELPCLARGTT